MAFPTAKHTLVVGHVMAFRATLSAAGGVCAAHVAPPLLVAMIVAVLLLPPTAKHTVALGQSTSFSWVCVVVGADCDVQVEPPFAVEMIVGNDPTRPPT